MDIDFNMNEQYLKDLAVYGAIMYGLYNAAMTSASKQSQIVLMTLMTILFALFYLKKGDVLSNFTNIDLSDHVGGRRNMLIAMVVLAGGYAMHTRRKGQSNVRRY